MINVIFFQSVGNSSSSAEGVDSCLSFSGWGVECTDEAIDPSTLSSGVMLLLFECNISKRRIERLKSKSFRAGEIMKRYSGMLRRIIKNLREGLNYILGSRTTNDSPTCVMTDLDCPRRV